MKHLIFGGLTLAALAVGCKKDTTDTTPATPVVSPKIAFLENKRWNLTALTAQRGSASVDGYANLKPCEKDDYLRFNDDRTLEANEGLLKCDTADPQTQAGNWELVNNDTRLLITTPLFGTGGAATPDILELSSARMVLRAVLIENSVTTVYTATLASY